MVLLCGAINLLMIIIVMFYYTDYKVVKSFAILDLEFWTRSMQGIVQVVERRMVFPFPSVSLFGYEISSRLTRLCPLILYDRKKCMNEYE